MCLLEIVTCILVNVTHPLPLTMVSPAPDSVCLVSIRSNTELCPAILIYPPPAPITELIHATTEHHKCISNNYV